jgi:hypothetical protein
VGESAAADEGCGDAAEGEDYLAVTRRGVWLIDVRPEPLIQESDRESFAATAEVAVACGWRYAVAARWREHAFAGLDAMASRRRLKASRSWVSSRARPTWSKAPGCCRFSRVIFKCPAHHRPAPRRAHRLPA